MKNSAFTSTPLKNSRPCGNEATPFFHTARWEGVLFLALMLLFISTRLATQTELWGTASGGGTTGHGAIFKINADGSGFTNYSLNSSAFEPIGGLTAYGGKFYGTTRDGGNFEHGTIFRFDPATSTFTILHHFNDNDGVRKGLHPGGQLLAHSGKLYGLADGGANGDGILYRFNPSGAVSFTVLRHFSESTGIGGGHPYFGLTLYDGKIYGETHGGGNDDMGALFKFNPSGSGSYTMLHSFEAADNSSAPHGGLTVFDGDFFGVGGGGDFGEGVIFKFEPGGGGEYSVVHHFGEDTDKGIHPRSLMRVGDIFFGTTHEGGSNDEGVLFSYSPAAGRFHVLHHFNCSTGCHPTERSHLVMSGTALFGTTYHGGSDDYGVIFKYDLATGDYTVLRDLDVPDGQNPDGDLLVINGEGIELCNGLDDDDGEVDEGYEVCCAGGWGYGTDYQMGAPMDDDFLASYYGHKGEEFTLDAWVINVGVTEAEEHSNARWYLSNDDVLDNSDYTKSSWKQDVHTLEYFESKDIDKTITLPTSSSWCGWNYMILKADADEEVAEKCDDDNTLPVPIFICCSGIDLRPQNIGAPGSAEPGQTINVSVKVKNQGSNAVGPTELTIYFQEPGFDPYYPDDYGYPAGTINTPALNGSQTSGALSVSVTIPGWSPLGEGKLLFVADWGNLTCEISETNNYKYHEIDIEDTDSAPGAPPVVNARSNNQGVGGTAAPAFRMFPNPAGQQVTLDLSPFAGQKVEVLIVNAMGQTIFSQRIAEVKGKLYPVELTDPGFLDGIYSITVLHRDGAISKWLAISRL